MIGNLFIYSKRAANISSITTYRQLITPRKRSIPRKFYLHGTGDGVGLGIGMLDDDGGQYPA